MDVYTYVMNGKCFLTLAPEVDAAHWHVRGARVAAWWKYRQVAQAAADVARLLAVEKRIGSRWRKRRCDSRRQDGSRHSGRLRHDCPRDSRRGQPRGERIAAVSPLDVASWEACIAEWHEWQPFCAGRSLLLPEVYRLLEVKVALPDHCLLTARRVNRALQVGVLRGEAHLLPAIERHKAAAAWKCERCQAGRTALREVSCATCGQSCVYCEYCLLLGRSTACTPLLQFLPSGRQDAVGQQWRRSHRVTVATAPTLTAAQQRAADEAVRFVSSSRDETMLLWAVTGAGKTEMTFAVIAHVLSCGQRVAVATPRKDVVYELAPRLKVAFPDTRVVTLHGDSAETWDRGELFVATTHQLLRAYRAFRLIVVDEIDAFPFRGDAVLAAAVTRALVAGGQQLWLTATPSRQQQAAFWAGKLPGVTIPVRHHRRPLPEPVLARERRLWQRLIRGQRLAEVQQFFAHVSAAGGQAYVFVPSVAAIVPTVAWLNRYVPDLSVAGVSSRDVARTDKVARFRAGELRCLVTTTILERGVTVPHAHVLILQADHPIFDEAALVQMSGRAGRSAAHPRGIVYWVAAEWTAEQLRARKHIIRMNREAQARGWLDE